VKRYNCTLSDKRGAFGLCMKEHEQGAFVPFSEISGLAEQLADATRQCGVMAELLRKARTNVDQVRRWGRLDHDEGCGAEAALLLARIDVALAGKETSRIITEGQEIELVTVLQSIVSGFSDDPAHDAAALLKRITGEVSWTGDSFQIPPRQGGEQIVKCPHCNAEHQDGSDAAEFIGWHGLCATCELKGGEPCATEPPSSSQA
jgi:hypothetical protein